MAQLFQVVIALGPRLTYGSTAELEEISEWVAHRSSLNKTEVRRVLSELCEVIVFFCRSGRPVRLPDLGRIRTAITRNGEIRLHFTPELPLQQQFNQKGFYRGDVKNRSKIGISNEAYKALWDALHPDDPMELPSGNGGGGEPPIEPPEPGEPEPGGGGIQPPEPGEPEPGEPGEPNPEPQPPSD